MNPRFLANTEKQFVLHILYTKYKMKNKTNFTTK